MPAIALVEALNKARADGPSAYLRFLGSLLQEQREAKWVEAGPHHRRWRRNRAIFRTRHVIHRDERTPWPLENHVWSLIEGSRPIWGDNVPRVQIVPLVPGESVARGAKILNRAWDWAAEIGRFADAWETLYDYLPVYGTAGLKVTFSGGRPLFSAVDPRAIYANPSARLNHRHARVLTMVHLVDVDEVKKRVPDISERISSAQRELGRREDQRDGSRETDRKVEVVEMWFAARPVEDTILDTEADSDDYLVITFVPDVTLLDEEIVETGRQVLVTQYWRNPDSIYGISDIDIIAGLQIAMDQLAIRGHSHRLAVFAPPFVLPKDSGVTRRQLSGRPAPILEPTDRMVADGMRYIDVPSPNREAVEFFLTRPQIMRRLLGTDEIRPELFDREQTASGLALLVSALENRMRQKMRNARPLVQDCVRTTLSLMMRFLPQGFAVRLPDGRFEEIPAGTLASLDLDNYAILTTLDKPGPLSKQARVAALERAIALGLFNTASPIPPKVREILLEEIEVPRREEIKAELEAAGQAEAIQQLTAQQEGGIL